MAAADGNSVVRVVNRHGVLVRSVEGWGRVAAPARAKHWKDGRSAKELTKAWMDTAGSDALVRLFETRAETAGLVIDGAVAEAQVAFDRCPGGKRNHDLLIRGRAAGRSVVIGLEAKADETFGETVSAYNATSRAKRDANQSTNAPERLAGLLADIAGSGLDETPALGSLHYQLFSGVAGTLAAAEHNATAVFVVHEFATSLTTENRCAANRKALADFVEVIAGALVPSDDWWLEGPFHVPGDRWAAIPLWIGHMTTNLLPASTSGNAGSGPKQFASLPQGDASRLRVSGEEPTDEQHGGSICAAPPPHEPRNDR